MHPIYNVSSNPEPPKFPKENSNFGTNFEKSHNESFVQWLLFRYHNAKDQVVPNFSGWLLQQRQKQIPISNLKQTVETHLPPIVSKVNEFRTVETYFEYLEKLLKKCNMPYTNITLDVGAAMNAYKYL